MIKIRNLAKQYKQFNDFRISCPELDINKGEIVGIYGSIASGKTLFSKIISGIHKKYDGLISKIFGVYTVAGQASSFNIRQGVQATSSKNG